MVAGDAPLQPGGRHTATEVRLCPIRLPARRPFCARQKLHAVSVCLAAPWKKHRSYGTGPTYRKLGGRVVYTPDDLRA
jgi:hypothetical protein